MKIDKKHQKLFFEYSNKIRNKPSSRSHYLYWFKLKFRRINTNLFGSKYCFGNEGKKAKTLRTILFGYDFYYPSKNFEKEIYYSGLL